MLARHVTLATLTTLSQWPRRALHRMSPSAWLPSVLPSSCALCGVSGDTGLCTPCRQRHLGSEIVRCACCGIAVGRQVERCGACLRKPPAFDATIVAVDYAPPLDQLLLALKFGGRLELAPLLASLLLEAVPTESSERPALLMPVPLGAQRLAERGFNQALEIARPLGRALGVRVERKLALRTRETAAQSLLHPDERHRNMSNAFALNAGAGLILDGLHVGVVDDVMTTGETLDALATVLKQAGAARVTNFVVARTPSA